MSHLPTCLQRIQVEERLRYANFAVIIELSRLCTLDWRLRTKKYTQIKDNSVDMAFFQFIELILTIKNTIVGPVMSPGVFLTIQFVKTL